MDFDLYPLTGIPAPCLLALPSQDCRRVESVGAFSCFDHSSMERCSTSQARRASGWVNVLVARSGKYKDEVRVSPELLKVFAPAVFVSNDEGGGLAGGAIATPKIDGEGKATEGMRPRRPSGS